MPLLTSWVETANSADTAFPLNNLPCGVFSTPDSDARCGVAIGDQIVDLAALEEAGLVGFSDTPVFDLPFWNDFMDLGADAWAELRNRLISLLSAGSKDRNTVARHLVPMETAQLHLPIAVSEFTDFYASRHHATNVGTMFRGANNALPPNWLHIPIGYNGRASTVVISGTDITRPNGQTKAPDAEMPVFGPCKRLDFELELGAIVGTSTADGPDGFRGRSRPDDFRLCAVERLVGARHSGVGVSTAGTVSGQGVCQHDQPVDRDKRRTGTVPLCGARARHAVAALSARTRADAF